MLMVVSSSRVCHILWAFSVVASKHISACWRVVFFNGVRSLFPLLPLPSHSLIFHCKHSVMGAWTTWCGVGAHSWVAEIACHEMGPLSRGQLATVEALRHPSLSPSSIHTLCFFTCWCYCPPLNALLLLHFCLLVHFQLNQQDSACLLFHRLTINEKRRYANVQ